jgi:hypothetical protein
MAFQKSQLTTYIQKQRANFEDLFGQMVETPSVSSDPTRVSDMQKIVELAFCLSQRRRPITSIPKQT